MHAGYNNDGSTHTITRLHLWQFNHVMHEQHSIRAVFSGRSLQTRASDTGHAATRHYHKATKGLVHINLYLKTVTVTMDCSNTAWCVQLTYDETWCVELTWDETCSSWTRPSLIVTRWMPMRDRACMWSMLPATNSDAFSRGILCLLAHDTHTHSAMLRLGWTFTRTDNQTQRSQNTK